MKKFFLIPLLTMLCTVMAWGTEVNSYAALKTALEDATETSVTLTANITIGSSDAVIKMVGTKTLNFNEFKITADPWKLEVRGTGVITFEGNGGIEVTGNGCLDVYSTAIINGGTYIASNKYAIYVNPNGVAEINGGTIKAIADQAALVVEGATATVNGGLIEGPFGIVVYDQSTLTVNDGTIHGTGSSGISGYGASTGASTINITGGTIYSDAAEGLGIYHPQDGTLNIAGGTISGMTGVYVKSGTVNVTGGTIQGTGAQTAYSFNGSGGNPTGDAIVIEACSYPGGAPEANITGGTFQSANANAIAEYEKNEEVAPADIEVSGGTFNTEVPAEMFAATFAPTETSPGVYTVATADYYRNNVTANNYGTLCLPKAGKVYGATLYEIEYKEGSSIVLVEVGSEEVVAGRPYVIQVKPDFTQITAMYTSDETETAQAYKGLVGSYTQALIAQSADHCIIKGNKFYHVDSDNVYVGEHRAYINLAAADFPTKPAASSARRRIVLHDASAQTTTAVDNVELSENAQKVMINGELFIIRGEQMYNAAGQLVK